MLTKLRNSLWVQVLHIAIVAIGFGYLIGYATELGILIPAAIPLGFVLVGAMAWLPARAQLIGWAILTAWLLAGVYLGASEVEYIAFIVVVLAAIAGVVWSPWFLMGVWLAHPLWDLIPRELPEHQHDLPLACLLYDSVVGIYLFWRIRSGFFAGAVAAPKQKLKFLSTGWSRLSVASYLLLIIVSQVLVVGLFSMDSNSIWIAPLVALGLGATIIWLPVEARKLFITIFTIWTAMTFAHSGELLEVLIFVALSALAILAYKGRPWLFVVIWAAHGLWHLFPREHLSHEAAMLMGHWMIPMAGVLFELTVAGLLALELLARKKSSAITK